MRWCEIWIYKTKKMQNFVSNEVAYLQLFILWDEREIVKWRNKACARIVKQKKNGNKNYCDFIKLKINLTKKKNGKIKY